ncbi:XRE family transcriptional regulator, partial [Pseudomonas putida S11]
MADLTAISEALGVSTAYFYNLSKPRSVSWVTRPHERRTLYLESGITDVLASPTIGGAFSMLDSHLEPGASSGELYLTDRSEQGCFRARRRTHGLAGPRRRRDPAGQRLLPAAPPRAVPLRQPDGKKPPACSGSST